MGTAIWTRHMGRHESVGLNIYSRAVSSAEAYPLTSTAQADRPQPVLRFGHENHQPLNYLPASARVTPPSGAPCGVSASRATSANTTSKPPSATEGRSQRLNSQGEWFLGTPLAWTSDSRFPVVRRCSSNSSRLLFPIHGLQFNCLTRRFGDETSVCSRGVILITQVQSEYNDPEYYSGHRQSIEKNRAKQTGFTYALHCDQETEMIHRAGAACATHSR